MPKESNSHLSIFLIIGIGLVAIVLVIGMPAALLRRNSLNSQRNNAPEIAAKLAGLKAACEGNARALQQRIIRGAKDNGRARYEKAEDVVDSCIAFLTISLSDRTAEEFELQNYLAEVDRGCNEFLNWSNNELGPNKYQSVHSDLIKWSGAVAEFIQNGKETRCKELVAELNKCKFHSWYEISNGTSDLNGKQGLAMPSLYKPTIITYILPDGSQLPSRW